MAPCPYCTYETDRKNNLKRHIVTMHHDSSKVLDCCGQIFKSKAALRDHVALFHKTGYKCHVCYRNFCRKALLRRHLAVHSGKKDFRCPDCQYATSHKSNLERHQKIHNKSGDSSSRESSGSPTNQIREFEDGDFSNPFSLGNEKRSHSDMKSPMQRISRTRARVVWRYQSLFQHRKHSNERIILNNNDCTRNNNEVEDVLMQDKEPNGNDKRCGARSANPLHKNGGNYPNYITTNSYINTVLRVPVDNAPRIESRLNIRTKYQCGSASRLSSYPYKCSKCGEYFETQVTIENHECRMGPIDDLPLPVTCMVLKNIMKCGITE